LPLHRTSKGEEAFKLPVVVLQKKVFLYFKELSQKISRVKNQRNLQFLLLSKGCLIIFSWIDARKRFHRMREENHILGETLKNVWTKWQNQNFLKSTLEYTKTTRNKFIQITINTYVLTFVMDDVQVRVIQKQL
jgi:hypothetical protein